MYFACGMAIMVSDISWQNQVYNLLIFASLHRTFGIFGGGGGGRLARGSERKSLHDDYLVSLSASHKLTQQTTQNIREAKISLAAISDVNYLT